MSRVCLFRQGFAQQADPSNLGSKGARLADMARRGLPVPAGFTLSSSASEAFLQSDEWPSDLPDEIIEALAATGRSVGLAFGDQSSPLFLSVSVSAEHSLPGLMDTVLNLGFTDATCRAFGAAHGDTHFAADCYLRWVETYGTTIAGIDRHHFEDARVAAGLASSDLSSTAQAQAQAQALQVQNNLLAAFKNVFRKHSQESFPQDPTQQLLTTLATAFRSWNQPRAVKFRNVHGLSHRPSLAVHVCAMVFGNRNETSGSGRCFTRDPATGQRALTGQYMAGAQGDDLVAGLRRPAPLSELARMQPHSYAQLENLAKEVELHFCDVQEVEFTIEDGALFLLHAHPAKRAPQATLRIAVDLAREGIITPAEALLRVKPTDLERLLHPALDPRAHRQVLARGLPASPGATAGRIVFAAADAELWANRGEAVILVREETSPEDIAAMHVAKGFLTTRGGMTSHTAVVARQLAKPCVAGCTKARILHHRKVLELGNYTLSEGDWLTLDGSTGDVILGKVATSLSTVSPELAQLIEWSVACQTMQVRANADTPAEARIARAFGACGIGLCRTEHMFFDEDRLPLVRQMILARSQQEREQALAALLPHQQNDFVHMLSTMSGLPVTIRLLDPPLHEFLPHPKEDLSKLSAQIGIAETDLRERIHQMSEQNPMLGHRGCRLGISHPSIYEMQVRAICRATAEVLRLGLDPKPEIMIPLVGLAKELAWLRARLETLCQAILAEEGFPNIVVPFGTMIEVPRAALTSHEIAAHADFFSFGTNDLTQTTFGFSRDDSASFMRAYEREGIMTTDPFASLDIDGVGELLKISIAKGRKTKPGLKVGICGEHAADPKSIRFLNDLELSYLSCSPYRLPNAGLASAQAAIIKKRNEGHPS